MKSAIGHLQRWCDISRMRFGEKKTQLVIYSTAQAPLRDDYRHLRLCDFTISIAHEYTYLGVVADDRLSWAAHRKVAISKARMASQRIQRICLRTKTPHLPSIRSFVLSYLIPVFEYGLLFWGQDIDSATCHTLQGFIVTPLRIAYQLPRTTHQLGVTHLFGLPTVRSLLLKAELSHLHRLSSLDTSHPTLKAHLQALAPVTNPRGNRKTHSLLQPLVAVPLALRITSSTIPQLYSPTSSLLPLLPSSVRDLLAAPPTMPVTDISIPSTYAAQIGAKAKKLWAVCNYPLHVLTTVVKHASSPAFGRSLVPTVVREITGWAGVDEWRRQHASPANPSATHTTTAPLIECKPDPGLAYLLRRTRESLRSTRRRVRLLMGRSMTGAVRHRFQKAGPDVNPNCTFPACANPSNPTTPVPLDSIQHMLLECPRHAAARIQYSKDLAGPWPKHPPLPVNLFSLLAASLPPRPFVRDKYDELIEHSNHLFDRIEAEREADGLLPLDTG